MRLTTTTERLGIFDEHHPYQEVYIGHSMIFSKIRQLLIELFNTTYIPDGDVADNEAALNLRLEISKLFTSPIYPYPDILEKCFLDKAILKRKFGEDVARKADELEKYIDLYREKKSSLILKFVQLYLDLINEYGESQVKIWCHPKECDAYRDALGDNISLADSSFICTLTNYRQSPLLEAIIKFGPLRTSGFGKSPSILATSPIYKRLIRFIWAGIKDDPNFGCDPVNPEFSYLSSMKKSLYDVHDQHFDAIQYSEPKNPDLDEFNIIEATFIAPETDHIPCVLVEFVDETSIFLRPKSNVLLLEMKGAEEARFDYQCPIEIEVGDYLVNHNANVDLGGVELNIEKYPVAKIWKNLLKSAYKQSPNWLVSKMRSSGINLNDLHRAAESWSGMRGTVVPAPRSKYHFILLLTKVLPIDDLFKQLNTNDVNQVCKLAWSE